MAYVLAALGGAIGSLARWALAEAIPASPAGWPWATLLVNLLGCLLLGLLVAALAERAPGSPWVRPFVGVGVLGGFTTYSTFAVETVGLADEAAAGIAAGYVVASVLGGVAAAAVGTLAGRRLAAGGITGSRA